MKDDWGVSHSATAGVFAYHPYYIKQGKTAMNLVAGIDVVFFGGGPALNEGLRFALEQEFGERSSFLPNRRLFQPQGLHS